MTELRDPQPDAVYERVLEASLERIWENVLDWEHLPYLHAQAFTSVVFRDGDADGWRGEVGIAGMGGAVAGIDVALDRANLRYMNRTVSGVGEGTEILTHLFPRGPRTTAIRVEFFFPWAPREAAAGIGEVYRSLYVGLWDQDAEMMLGRQAVIDAADARRDPASSRREATSGCGRISLGRWSEVIARAPIDLVVDGRPLRIAMVDGRPVAFDTRCPHLGGPLRETASGSCEAVCPWHGYRFDLRSGESLDGRRLRLARAPRVEVEEHTGEVSLVL